MLNFTESLPISTRNNNLIKECNLCTKMLWKYLVSIIAYGFFKSLTLNSTISTDIYPNELKG